MGGNKEYYYYFRLMAVRRAAGLQRLYDLILSWNMVKKRKIKLDEKKRITFWTINRQL